MAPHDVTITIRKLEDLFVDRIDENPLLPEWEADAGIQRVANFLKIRRLGRGVRVTIRLPDTLLLTPVLKERVHAAILRYCDARIAENRRERHFTVLTGLTGLGYGIIVSLLLSVVLNWLVPILPLPEWLETSLAGLVGIAVWAIVWGPLAAIFFDWLPNWTSIRVYKCIRRGEFVYEPVPMSEPLPAF